MQDHTGEVLGQKVQTSVMNLGNIHPNSPRKQQLAIKLNTKHIQID